MESLRWRVSSGESIEEDLDSQQFACLGAPGRARLGRPRHQASKRSPRQHQNEIGNKIYSPERSFSEF